MKKIITFVLILWTSFTFAQQTKVHTRKSGHCAVINFPDATTTQLISSSSGEWCEPIRISVGIQEGLAIANSVIESAIAEDSQIDIDDGLYTGDEDAHILIVSHNLRKTSETRRKDGI